MLDVARNVQHMKENSFAIHHLFPSPRQFSLEIETKLVSLDEPQVTFIQYAVFPDTLRNITWMNSPLANPKSFFFFSIELYK